MLRGRESGGVVLGGGLSGFPVIGEEVVEAVDGMSADAVEDVEEVSEGVDLESLAGRHKAGEDRGGSPAVVASEEQPVFSSDSNSPQAAFGAVVVYLEVSVPAVSAQGVPVRQHV